MARSQLHFRAADANDSDALGAMVRWANDESIRHLFRHYESAEEAAKRKTLVAAASELAASLEHGRQLYFIVLDGDVVGEVNFVMNPPYLHEPKGATAWFGIVLGEDRARGRGIGRQAMQHIEDAARREGAEWGQIGVWEFNERARHLYASLGYEIIARRPEATWWKDQRWTDIRMQKPLLRPERS